ncbi:MAG: hypothetical protein ACREDG_05245, partial [Methylocella sp.]
LDTAQVAESAIDFVPRHEFEASGRACPDSNYKAAAPERSTTRCAHNLSALIFARVLYPPHPKAP